MWSEVLAYLVVACGYHLDPESRRNGRVSEMGESLDLVEVSKHSLSGYTTKRVSSCSASARSQEVPEWKCSDSQGRSFRVWRSRQYRRYRQYRRQSILTQGACKSPAPRPEF